tara:strand:+ start:439 stop:600 length:162 start_codon:yes stop_codon:yes gene_type:complete
MEKNNENQFHNETLNDVLLLIDLFREADQEEKYITSEKLDSIKHYVYKLKEII